MDERLKFIARLFDGEKMAVLCRAFGVSRKTGYKILDRYHNCGLEGLTNRSRRPCRRLPDLDYPFHDRAVRVTQCGRICMGHRKINLSVVFAGQIVGIKEVADYIWLVSFWDYDLGFFDEEAGRVEPATNPFAPEV